MPPVKRLSGAAVVLGLLGLVTALVLWWLPANDFFSSPDQRQAARRSSVEVEGGKTNAKGDVYYVDLFVRRIRLLEQLLPFTRPEGATLVPGAGDRPDRETDEERNRQNAADMKRSEEVGCGRRAAHARLGNT